MKFLRIAPVLFLLAPCATPAWAQFGTYGSPQMLYQPPRQPAATPYRDYAPVQPQFVPAPPTRLAYTPSGAYGPRNPVRPTITGIGPAAGARFPAQPAPPLPPPGNPPVPNPLTLGPAKPSGNLISQMLDGSDARQTSLSSSSSSSSYYGGDDDSPCDGCGTSDKCGGLESCGAGYLCGHKRTRWYASTAMLAMARDEPNHLYTSYETGNDPNQFRHGEMSWSWGGEIRFGRRFCRGFGSTAAMDGALEATYWGLNAFNGVWAHSHPSTVSTSLVVSGIEFPNPAPPPAMLNGTFYFDNATAHRIWRQNEFHNVELNLLLGRKYNSAVSRWDVDWLVGLRFFRFEESFTFGSVASPWAWGMFGGIYEAYINDQVTNDLFGFQFGFDADYHLLRRCRLFLTPKLAICNNQIDHHYHIYRGDGTPAQPTLASGQTGTFPVDSSEENISFLMQIDAGLQWDFAPNWSARIGYRVLTATGIALADNQIPQYVVDIPVAADIDTNGELVLHGGFVGVAYNF